MANMTRVYFNAKTLDDALLKSYVTPQIVQESSQYVESVALSFGVSTEQIATPTPFMVSQLGLFWAYMTAAWRKAQFSKGDSAENDSFYLKFRLYKEMLDALLSQLTVETFTGGTSAKKRKFPATMSISRN